MAESTAIEWCDSTFNPWLGCTKISPACDHCYAESWAKRSGLVKWDNEPRRRTSAAAWHEPVKWQRQAAKFFAQHGRRRRVFCASLADVFDNQVLDEWRANLWSLIEACPDLDWLLLTKRPQNIGKMLPSFWDEVKGRVWLGTTVEDQARADQNIPHLLQHDAAVRFVSVEPMLGPIDLHSIDISGDEEILPLGARWLDRLEDGEGEVLHIDWVIAGGESGMHARPPHPDWFRSLRDQCAAAGVPFLFKQWGEWAPGEFQMQADGLYFQTDDGKLLPGRQSWQALHHFAPVPEEKWPAGRGMAPIGKKATGRLLDGIEHNGFPEAAI